MISTLKLSKQICRYVTVNSTLKALVLPNGFHKTALNRRTYHDGYVLGSRGQIITSVDNKNLVIGLQETKTFRRFFSSTIVEELTVKHDPDEGKFYIDLPGVGCAYIEYERNDELIILKHTDVPNELGGRGIGKLLAKEALEYVAKNDLQLEIECSFVRKYVSKYEPKFFIFKKIF